MTSTMIAAFRETDDVQIRAGIDASVFEQVAALHRVILPPVHREVLGWSNGMETYTGYFRLFGLGATAGMDMLAWNHPEYWKFAWQDRCSAYWCFGETAWGDQYAYSIESLYEGQDGEVYFLDAVSMTPEVIATSFADFLENELLRSAREPYDQMIRLARQKFGPLEISSHLVYMPSLLLGGTETVENVQTMNARAAMICNGDLAVELDAGPPNGTVKSVQSYEDAHGRMRLRVLWT